MGCRRILMVEFFALACCSCERTEIMPDARPLEIYACIGRTDICLHLGPPVGAFLFDLGLADRDGIVHLSYSLGWLRGQVALSRVTMFVDIKEGDNVAPSRTLQGGVTVEPPEYHGEVTIPYCDFYLPEGNLLTITFSLRYHDGSVVAEMSGQVIFGCRTPGGCVGQCP